jgi:hypothetical protein
MRSSRGCRRKQHRSTPALGLLRDHACEGAVCNIGDRRAIDAFIATHGVVADLTAKTLWISAGPRLSGRFVKLDPDLLVRRQDDLVPVPSTDVASLPEDPALHDGRYMEGRARAGGPFVLGMSSSVAHS